MAYFKNYGRQFGALVVFFFMAWMFPPLWHGWNHLCPVRPDGLDQAEAVPAFARKYNVSCSMCHVAFPMLNAFGRQFKLNGYVMDKESETGVMKAPTGNFWTEKIFPWGVVVRSRPYDWSASKNGDFSMQAIQDVDLFFAGGDVARRVSWFGEIDANSDGGFTPAMGDLQLGYHPYAALNILAARRGFFVMDPYQTLSNFGSPTIADRAIAGKRTDQGSFSTDVLDTTKQTIALYGQTTRENLGMLYYSAGVTADNSDDTGVGRKDGNVRIALDSLRGIMLGGFSSFGTEGGGLVSGGPADEVQFAKYGVDTLIELGSFGVRGAFLAAKDTDMITNAVETNRAAYGEAYYAYRRAQDDFPFLMPLVRENWYETANGTQQFNYVTAQLAHYFKPNVKAFVEYTGDTKQDDTSASPDPHAPMDHRWTAQVEVGF